MHAPPRHPTAAAAAGAGPSGGQVPAVTDNRPLLQSETAQIPASHYAIYDLRRYRPYFDVSTRDVLWRVLRSVIGMFVPDFLDATMEKPDL